MKIHVSLLFIFLSCRFLSQENQVDSVKYFTMKSAEADNKNQKKLALELSDRAIKLSLKNNNEEQMVRSHIFKAELCARYGYHDDSFKYINLIKDYDYGKKNNFIQARIKLVKSINYQKLGLDSLYLKENKEILMLLSPNSEVANEIKVLLRAINRIEYYYETHHNKKLSELYFKKYESIIQNRDPNVFIAEYSGYLGNKGQRLLEKKQYDSVLYYFQKDYDFVIQKGESFPYKQLKNIGNYYYDTQNHQKALEFYEKAINIMEKSGDKNSDYLPIYKRISELYGTLGKKENEIEFLKKYTEVADTIAQNRKPALQKAVAEIVNEEKEKEQQKIKAKIGWIASLIILLFTGVLLYLRNIRKKKNHLQKEYSQKIKEKENVLETVLLENQRIQESKSITITDLVEMVKQNDLSFLVHFESVFPDFRNTMTNLSSEINNTDLEILAFTYLGFSTKNIAKFTYKSVRTIQNKKYIIRKKLNIDSDVLLDIWIKEKII